MKTVVVLSVPTFVIAFSASLLGQAPKGAALAPRPAPLVVQLAKELRDAGWTVDSVVDPEKPPTGVVQVIVLENKKLERNVLRKDKQVERGHAVITLTVFSKDKMPELLAAWDAEYGKELRKFRELVEKNRATAVAPPRKMDSKLFWQADRSVILAEDTSGPSREEEAVKAAIKRQLIGQ